jgi:hypothetical protein
MSGTPRRAPQLLPSRDCVARRSFSIVRDNVSPRGLCASSRWRATHGEPSALSGVRGAVWCRGWVILPNEAIDHRTSGSGSSDCAGGRNGGPAHGTEAEARALQPSIASGSLHHVFMNSRIHEPLLLVREWDTGGSLLAKDGVLGACWGDSGLQISRRTCAEKRTAIFLDNQPLFHQYS